MDIKPPINTKEFKKYWNELAPIITEKQGFDKSCTKNLEILCILYTTFDRISKYLDESELFLESSGRYGDVVKSSPAINERQKIVAEIRHYSKLLGMDIQSNPKEGDTTSDWV